MRRIDVRRASSQQERVQSFRFALQSFGTGGERKQYSLAARSFHGMQIFVDFDAPVGGFFRGGAPRYADARAGKNTLGHGRIHRNIGQHGQQYARESNVHE